MALLIENRLVTEGRADRQQTQHHSILEIPAIGLCPTFFNWRLRFLGRRAVWRLLTFAARLQKAMRRDCHSIYRAYIGWKWQWRNFFISAAFRHFVGQALGKFVIL